MRGVTSARRPRAGWSGPDLAIVALFVGSIAGAFGGGASLVKVAFPAAVTLLAVGLADRSPAHYLKLLLWTIFLAPGLRHVVDYHTSFSQSNPIMLSTFLIVFAATPSILLHLLNARRYAFEFIVLILSVLSGLGIALQTGAILQPMLAGMRWLAPLWFGLYLLAHAESLPAIRHAVQRSFLLGLPVIAIYGIVQFVDIQPWDIYYMKMAPIDSIGYPVPFAVRVFGTLNSPGTLVDCLATGILLLLPNLRGARWLLVPLCLGAMVLTTQRAAFASFVLAIVVLLVLGGNGGLRRRVGGVVVAIVVVCGLLLSVPEVAKKIDGIANSMVSLQKDDSAKHRLEQYEQVFATLDQTKLGRGLSWQNNSLYIADGHDIPVDSGFIDVYVALGVLGGTLFLVFIGILTCKALAICSRHPGPASAEFAGLTFGLAQFPAGSVQEGEAGILIFLCLGLLLSRRMALPVRNRSLDRSGPRSSVPPRPSVSPRRSGGGLPARPRTGPSAGHAGSFGPPSPPRSSWT